LKLEIEAADRGRNEIIDIAVKAFGISQSRRVNWVSADSAGKRCLLEIISLNCTFDDVSLLRPMRKPFDQLAEGLDLKNSRFEK